MIVNVTSSYKHTIKNGGLSALRDRLIGKKTVKVGFPAGPVEANGVSTAQVAAVHEFGSPSENIPERSFMRSGIIEGEKQQISLNRVNLLRVLVGEMDMQTALGKLGELGKAQIQHKLKIGPFEPLKASTIKARRSRMSPSYRKKLDAKVEAMIAEGKKPGTDFYKPLIDTGHMRDSVTWEIGDD